MPFACVSCMVHFRSLEVAGRVLLNRFSLSFLPSVCQSRGFVGDVSYAVVLDGAGIFEKNNFAPGRGKWVTNVFKKGYFKYIEVFGDYFFLNIFYNKLYIICYFIMYRKNMVPEIWAEMLLAIQVAVILNQPYL